MSSRSGSSSGSFRTGGGSGHHNNNRTGSSGSFGMRLDLNDVSLCGREKEIQQLNSILSHVGSKKKTKEHNKSTTTNGSSNGGTAKDLTTINENGGGGTGGATNGNSPDSFSSCAMKVAKSRRALVTVTGSEGIGKTSVVLSQQESWINDKDCLFGHGSFSRHKFEDSSKLQFTAIFDAVTDLIRMWIEKEKCKCDGVKNEDGILKCQAKLKDFAYVMNDQKYILRKAVPHLCELLGMSEDDKGTPRRNSSTEFNVDTASTGCSFSSMKNALQKVLSYLCRGSDNESRPVVLFFDNFQNACPLSMDILKFVVECNALEGLMVVVSYRDIDEDHWIAKGFQELEATSCNPNGCCPIHHIQLQELEPEKVNCMVSQILERSQHDDEDLKETIEFSNIVHSKTGGNPFYVLQVSLHQDSY